MAIKGQNLRIFLDNADRNRTKPIAGALSCSVNFNVETQDVTTKDSPDGWNEIEVSKIGWEIQAEAVIQKYPEYYMGENREHVDITGSGISSDAWYDPNAKIHFNDAGTYELKFKCLDGDQSYQIGILNSDRTQVLDYTHNFGHSEWTTYLTVTANTDVYPCYIERIPAHDAEYWAITVRAAGSTGTGSNVVYFPLEKNLIDVFDYIQKGDKVMVWLHLTTGTDHREADPWGISYGINRYGTGYVTSLQVTAANRERGTFSITISGDDELVQEVVNV